MKKSKKIQSIILKIINQELKAEKKWNKKELQKIQMYSRDLLKLENKMAQVKRGQSKAKVKEYQSAAQRIFNHIALMGLEKIAMEDKNMQKMLKNKLIGLLKGSLKILLAALLT